MRRFPCIVRNSLTHPATLLLRPISTKCTSKNADDEWNNAWETAWIPDDVSGKNRAPWESDVNFSLSNNDSIAAAATPSILSPDVDADTKAFVEDMTDNWDQRRKSARTQRQEKEEQRKNMEKKEGNSMYSLENRKRDYRLQKQMIHAGLWVKEIDKQEEAKLGDEIGGGGDDIERLLDSCSEIFDSPNDDLSISKLPTSSEFKNKPDGWETTAKVQDGSVWEMSQREEDILLQEFERRIAFCKFQISSFIKTHIFSRRRPIDGWKYMIEEIGPNAKKGKGDSVSRLPTLSDASTQPFKEEKTRTATRLASYKRR